MANTPATPIRQAPDVRGQAGQSSAAASHAGKMTSNFLALSAAEIVCRGTSVGVTLYLAKKLGAEGNGRVELAFNIVYWLVLVVRDGLEVIAAREIARHPRVVRSLVNHILSVKLLIAGALYALVLLGGGLGFAGTTERTIVWLYGLLLFTTALGIDFAYRGLERMGLIAISLVIRTSVYAVGVALCVADMSRITWVPAWLVLGEAIGIAFIWLRYSLEFGIPRPMLGGRFLRVALKRGKHVYLIQISQAIICSADVLVVGLVFSWSLEGQYAAQHRWVSAVLTFGLIFQQVAFPRLAKSWREGPSAGRRALDKLVAILASALLPLAVGAGLLADKLTAFLLLPEYSHVGTLLAIGVWRAPLLTVAFLYQSALIALGRERGGVRLLVVGAAVTGPLVALGSRFFGLVGAISAATLSAFLLAAAGYHALAAAGCAPKRHHHLLRPIVACLVMAPVSLAASRLHVLAGVGLGGLAYAATLLAIGGAPWAIARGRSAENRGPIARRLSARTLRRASAREELTSV